MYQLLMCPAPSLGSRCDLLLILNLILIHLFLLSWFCHFDDDNYVNVPRLLALLRGFDPRLEWYLGKPSIRAPLEILNRDVPQVRSRSLSSTPRERTHLTFSFSPPNNVE